MKFSFLENNFSFPWIPESFLKNAVTANAQFMFDSVLGLFFFQHESVNQYVERGIVQGHEDRPVQNTIAYYLEHAGVYALNLTLWSQAVTAMLDHLRKMNGYIRYHITVDGLYLSAGFIDQAVKLGHSVTMPLAKEAMVIHKILDVRFGNGRPSVQIETVSERTTVAYEAEDIAPFWDALHEKNPLVALYGLRRTIVNKVTGEVRECPIVTTIVPTAHNAMAISDIQREKWQEENLTFNDLKTHHHLEHVFNHKAQAQVFMFAALATNMRTIYLLRHPPQRHVRKPLTIASVVAAILKACNFDPLRLFAMTPVPAID
jgi:hypothetical protein